MKRLVVASIALAGGLVGCTDKPMTPAELLAAQALVTVVGAAVPGGSAGLAIGQLLCNTPSGPAAVFDASSSTPFLVTGQPAPLVAKVCGLISGQPVPPPGSKITVPAVQVAIPAA